LTYSIFIEKSAQKDLAKIPRKDQNRIIKSIEELSRNPRPAQSKKLTGRDAWRIRVGDYRVIYEIYDIRLLILIVVIGHRKDIYKI
jgi:mRNA interferase RelE/StbE